MSFFGGDSGGDWQKRGEMLIFLKRYYTKEKCCVIIFIKYQCNTPERRSL